MTRVEVSEDGREALKDVAGVLSGMCGLIVIRTFAHSIVRELSAHASVPVINALTDHSHPCQILSDLYTLRRAGRDLDKLTVAWVGDGNNVLHRGSRRRRSPASGSTSPYPMDSSPTAACSSRPSAGGRR